MATTQLRETLPLAQGGNWLIEGDPHAAMQATDALKQHPTVLAARSSTATNEDVSKAFALVVTAPGVPAKQRGELLDDLWNIHSSREDRLAGAESRTFPGDAKSFCESLRGPRLSERQSAAMLGSLRRPTRGLVTARLQESGPREKTKNEYLADVNHHLNQPTNSQEFMRRLRFGI